MKHAAFLLLIMAFAVPGFSQVKINGYEYWFDGNYMGKVVTAITPVNSYPLNTQINTNALPYGLHTFNIRFKDNNTKYTAVLSTFFYKTGLTITGYEYWIDRMYSNKVLKTVKDSSTVSINLNVNAIALNTGIHQFDIRFRNNAGIWSSVKSSYFIRGAKNIVAYEYWFDNDYTNKITQTVSPPTSTVTINTDVHNTNTVSGTYQLTIRFKDDAGGWSAPFSKSFFQLPIDTDKDGLPNITEAVRYGTDTTNLDTNNDLLADGINVFTGLPPLAVDTDGDDISNLQEIINGTNPVLWDTDSDGVSDKLDPFPLDRFRTKLPPKKPSDVTAPIITLSEPL